MANKKRGIEYHRKNSGRKEVSICADGIDSSGKGLVERAITEYEQKLGRAVYDTIAFSIANKKGLPELKDFWNPPNVQYHTIVTAEPTYAGIGDEIRTEIIAKNLRDYSAQTQTDMFAVNREILFKRVSIPALQNGLRDIHGRSIASSLCYQVQEYIDEYVNENPRAKKAEIEKVITKARKYILSKPGNQLALEWAPDLMIIMALNDPSVVIERMQMRAKNGKDDAVKFENKRFQTEIQAFYESAWLKNLFEERGTQVEYLNADISTEHTREATIRIYKNFLKEKGLPYN